MPEKAWSKSITGLWYLGVSYLSPPSSMNGCMRVQFFWCTRYKAVITATWYSGRTSLALGIWLGVWYNDPRLTLATQQWVMRNEMLRLGTHDTILLWIFWCLIKYKRIQTPGKLVLGHHTPWPKFHGNSFRIWSGVGKDWFDIEHSDVLKMQTSTRVIPPGLRARVSNTVPSH